MPTRYDTVRYSRHAFFHTHPDRMAVVGRLFGLDPAPPERCRVLELGVSSGANLLPMAVRLPESTFYGVDLAESAVAEAQAAIDALGLTNARVEVRDINTLEDGFAEFDYIICHGVYSWVPAEVRERILRLAKSCLAPNGVAYISYNVLPGWHLLNIARDVMRLHGERFEEPMEQVEQGLAFVGFLAEALKETDGPYSSALRVHKELLRRHAANYVYHDFFSPVNVPFLFRDFISDAGRVGLQFLGEAEFGEMLTTGLPDRLKETLEQLSQDILTNEQYIDLVRCRTFRRTLLCHRDIDLRRGLNAEALRGLHISAAISPTATEGELYGDGPLELKTPEGATITIRAAEAKAALRIIWENTEESIAFEELVQRAWAAVGGQPPDREDEAIAAVIVHGFAQGAFHLFPRRHGAARTISERPMVDAWLRHQIALGDDNGVNLRHESAALDRFDKELFPLMDGTRTVVELEEAVMEHIREGRLEARGSDAEAVTEDDVRDAVRDAIQTKLAAWARASMLSG